MSPTKLSISDLQNLQNIKFVSGSTGSTGSTSSSRSVSPMTMAVPSSVHQYDSEEDPEVIRSGSPGVESEEAKVVISGSAAEHFFEGVEKLLEVWFTTRSGVIDGCDLRKIPR